MNVWNSALDFCDERIRNELKLRAQVIEVVKSLNFISKDHNRVRFLATK